MDFAGNTPLTGGRVLIFLDLQTLRILIHNSSVHSFKLESKFKLTSPFVLFLNNINTACGLLYLHIPESSDSHRSM